MVYSSTDSPVLEFVRVGFTVSLQRADGQTSDPRAFPTSLRACSRRFLRVRVMATAHCDAGKMGRCAALLCARLCLCVRASVRA